MDRIQHILASLVLAVLVLMGTGGGALACTICYGEPGNPMTMGVQNGVLLLMGAIGVVLALFVALIVMFIRRGKRLAREAEMAESAS